MYYSHKFNQEAFCSDTISRDIEKDGVAMQQSWKFEATPNKKGHYDIVESIQRHDGTTEQKLISTGIACAEQAQNLVKRHYNLRLMTVGQSA